MNALGGSDDLFRWQYPSADMTAREFENFVADAFEQATPYVDDLRVTLHDTVEGTDGTYDFDATIRYTLAGMDFLVVVEAKRHSYPIKREAVQALHSKLESVGAQKGVLVSTAPFQNGALEFALVHGIALVKVTEGRFTYETKSSARTRLLSRGEALRILGLPTFVGHCYRTGSEPGSIACTVVTGQPEDAARLLLGVQPAPL